MPKKAAPPPRAPLKTYGYRGDVAAVEQQLGPNAQLFFNQFAFAHHAKAIDHGAPPREDLFWEIANVIFPGYFIRDPWSERLIRGL